MAIGLININKIEENFGVVTYHYHTDDSGVGIVTMDRGTGDFKIFRIAEGDHEYGLSKMVYWALLKHWREGALPGETFWAS